MLWGTSTCLICKQMPNVESPVQGHGPTWRQCLSYLRTVIFLESVQARWDVGALFLERAAFMSSNSIFLSSLLCIFQPGSSELSLYCNQLGSVTDTLYWLAFQTNWGLRRARRGFMIKGFISEGAGVKSWLSEYTYLVLICCVTVPWETVLSKLLLTPVRHWPQIKEMISPKSNLVN